MWPEGLTTVDKQASRQARRQAARRTVVGGLGSARLPSWVRFLHIVQ